MLEDTVMQLANILILMVILGAVTACANQIGPNGELWANVPTVQMGGAKTQLQDYVLYIPKGQAFPVEIGLTGYLLEAPVSEVFTATLNRDLYLYKKWMSYDGTTWTPLNSLLGVALSMGMDNEKGHITAELTDRAQ